MYRRAARSSRLLRRLSLPGARDRGILRAEKRSKGMPCVCVCVCVCVRVCFSSLLKWMRDCCCFCLFFSLPLSVGVRIIGDFVFGNARGGGAR